MCFLALPDHHGVIWSYNNHAGEHPTSVELRPLSQSIKNNELNPAIVIFSDLDGCLLNKSDYDFRPAIPTLQRIRKSKIPLVLASSKTEPEMRQLAAEMQIADAPLICENGGVVFWSRTASELDANNKTVLGVERVFILNVLAELKSDFKFRSFEDLQVPGICETTDLPPERARTALARSCTEPLIWDDEESKIDLFRKTLEEQSLTFTRGGRFWHVAGKTTKGAGMELVLKRMRRESGVPVVTIAVGDSAIDQSMLNVADYPVGIPWPDGNVQVQIPNDNGIVASEPGSAGWAAAVSATLDRLES